MSNDTIDEVIAISQLLERQSFLSVEISSIVEIAKKSPKTTIWVSSDYSQNCVVLDKDLVADLCDRVLKRHEKELAKIESRITAMALLAKIN